MNATCRKLSALALGFSVGMAAFPAYSQAKGKDKPKGKQHLEVKEKHGRSAGTLPFGLEQFSEKQGQLPSGLQKNKAGDGSLTRGLEEGGKRPISAGKGKKRTP